MKKQKFMGMGRRQALQRLVTGAGATAAFPALGRAEAGKPTMRSMPVPDQLALGAAAPPDPSLASPDWKPKFFDEHENDTVVVISDLIIPDTDTPGAKAAQVNRFIDLYLAAETPDTQKQYLQALAWLDGYCLTKYTKPFTGLARSEQDEVLTLFTRRPAKGEPAPGIEQFQTLKRSIVDAYYSPAIDPVP